MCLVDASLGMVVTFVAERYFLQGGALLSVASIIIGALAGTAFYAFCREVVAVRWLKVQPNGGHA